MKADVASTWTLGQLQRSQRQHHSHSLRGLGDVARIPLNYMPKLLINAHMKSAPSHRVLVLTPNHCQFAESQPSGRLPSYCISCAGAAACTRRPLLVLEWENCPWLALYVQADNHTGSKVNEIQISCDWDIYKSFHAFMTTKSFNHPQSTAFPQLHNQHGIKHGRSIGQY
jgi:hypothetical protein